MVLILPLQVLPTVIRNHNATTARMSAYDHNKNHNRKHRKAKEGKGFHVVVKLQSTEAKKTNSRKKLNNGFYCVYGVTHYQYYDPYHSILRCCLYKQSLQPLR